MKKGFTLIELLAVIIILALIGLVTIIGVTTLITKSKDDLYETQMKSIGNAAKAWANENIDKLPAAGECIYLTLDSLKTYGLLDTNIVNPKTDEKIDDDLKIRIDSRLNSHNKVVIEYLVDAEDVDSCRKVYGDYTLVEGVTFNARLKTLAHSSNLSADSNIKSIVFLKTAQIPSNLSLESFNSYENIDLSVNEDRSVVGYFINGTVYVYSEGVLQANTVSNGMFSGLAALESIDFSGLSTTDVQSMTSMFEGCSSIRILNLSNFNTSNTVRMNRMFFGCSSLQDLDISSFDISKVELHDDMFDNCDNINVTINASMKTFIEERLTESEIEKNITIK